MRCKIFSILALTLGTSLCLAGGQVALTIDDLPFLGHIGKDGGKARRETNRFQLILTTLQQEKIPAIGFVIAGAIEPGQMELLEAWRKSGLLIGNHTYSHKLLSHMETNKYIADVDKADQVLKPLMTEQKYFRYPGLSEGRNPEQEGAVKNFLVENHYSVAPVSIDSKDYLTNKYLLDIPWQDRKARLQSICNQYANHIWNLTERQEKKDQEKLQRPVKQILLIHMNYLNAYCLRDVIQMYRKHDYQFITLQEALQDPYYAHRDEVTQPKKVATETQNIKGG